jgi:hypothetical protein
MGRIYLVLQIPPLEQPLQRRRFRHERGTQCSRQPISNFHHHENNQICAQPDSIIDNMYPRLGLSHFCDGRCQNPSSPLRMQIFRQVRGRNVISGGAHNSGWVVHEAEVGKLATISFVLAFVGSVYSGYLQAALYPGMDGTSKLAR